MSKKNSKMTFGGKFALIDFVNNYWTDSITINEDDCCCESEHIIPVTTATICSELYITKVYYNNPATIVFWNDGTKTVTKCHGSDVYSPEMGLIICCFKKLIGGSQFKKLLYDWAPNNLNYEQPVFRTLADLRREFKKENK